MKKRELTEEEKRIWLEENGQPPKAHKAAPISISKRTTASKKSTASQPLTLGDVRGVDKKRVAARPEATVDLHGLTQNKAYTRVVHFVTLAAEDGLRSILIITGKSGVLRRLVPEWLDTPALRPFILALTYATPKQGGEGALRVLLKRRR